MTNANISYFTGLKFSQLTNLLFAFYLFLFAWLVTKVKFFKESGLTKYQLIILFLLKVIAGTIYGWIGVYYSEVAQMVDTWGYHYDSIKEYQTLITHPGVFFTDIFHNSYQDGYTNFLTTQNSWWNDLKGNSLVKLLALFNIFSFGSYYTNVIFYCFISFFGPVAIYRVMKDQFPENRIALMFGTFLIPSFLYWTSGLHKEGILFLGLAMIIYHIYFMLKEKNFSFSRLVIILLGFIILLGLRNFLILVLVPSIVAWILSTKVKWQPVFTYGVVFSISILFFFTAKYIHPKLDLPHSVVLKQEEFIQLEGNSSIAVNKLQPSFSSFLINAPQAFSISTLRPYPSNVKHLLSMAAAIEVAFLFLLFLIFLFFRSGNKSVTPFKLFCVFFSFSVLMMIGYTVNVLGAVVRYRSIILPILVVPMVASINWKKIGGVLFDNMNNNYNV